jgi:bifunctional DNase/RNase
MIQVEVTNAFMLNRGNDFVILLRSRDDSRALPIAIGHLEAQSIAIKLNDIAFPRPLTHDLLKSVLDTLGCRLVQVEVCDLRDDTFFARLVLLDSNGCHNSIDSRPSDAIALALRFDVPILVDENVMEQAGVAFTGEEDSAGETVVESAPMDTSALSPLEQLEERLAAAVNEERYEDAARLRDEIKNARQSN